MEGTGFCKLVFRQRRPSPAASSLELMQEDCLGDLLRADAGVPTSLKPELHATCVGIPLLPLGGDRGPARIHLSIDGADEVDPGRPAVAPEREKMIEGAGEKFVVIVDESKLVPRLGCSGAVPVEVIPFGAPHTLGLIRKVFDGLPGFHARLRMVKKDADEDTPFMTDNGNYIVEMFFEDGIRGDLQNISDQLLRVTGVVEHGMLLSMATTVIVANKDGTITVMDKKN